jgi:hypothetical protein
LPICVASPTIEELKSRVPKNFSYSVYYQQAPEGGYVAFVPAESLVAHGEAIPEERRSFQGRLTVPA